MGKLEKDFQHQVKRELIHNFEGCVVVKLDATFNQGIPDLLVLYKDKWASLECKRSSGASHRPNQDYNVEKMNNMSFSRFIYPENKEEVMNELRVHFQQA